MEKTNSDMPEPETTAVAFPDWVMLDRSGRSKYYGERDPVHVDLEKAVDDSAAVGVDTTVVRVGTSSGLSGYLSFTLATPPRVSYLDLYWPTDKSSDFPIHPVYPSVLAADENLVLLRIAIPGPLCYHSVPADLFVYTAARPLPSLKKLPLHTAPAPEVKDFRNFFKSKFDIGILRLAGDQGQYVVADLLVSRGDDKIAQLCVFSTASKTRTPWSVFKKPAPRPGDGGQFPVSWSTNTVIPFDGRFLCWVDYYSGILLSDFSETNAPVLRFVPFPGEQYTDERYRIDSDDESTDDEDDTEHEKSDPKITIWTLNVAEFKWELHCEMALDKIWEQLIYKQGILEHRLPEFPVISVDNPDLVWCVLRKKDFRGKAWMAEVDMKRAELRTFTPYVNEHPYCGQNMKLKNSFHDVPPLPTVFSKYLKNATGILGGNDKFATRPSKKGKLSM